MKLRMGRLSKSFVNRLRPLMDITFTIPAGMPPSLVALTDCSA